LSRSLPSSRRGSHPDRSEEGIPFPVHERLEEDLLEIGPMVFGALVLRVARFYLLRAFLSEFREQWSTGRKYLEMTEYHEWKIQQESFKSSPTLAIVE